MSKINNTFLDNAENLDIIIPIYNLLVNSDNYSMASGCLWNYFRDEEMMMRMKIIMLIME